MYVMSRAGGSSNSHLLPVKQRLAEQGSEAPMSSLTGRDAVAYLGMDVWKHSFYGEHKIR